MDDTLLAKNPIYDFAVVGGGLLGLATARALLTRHPGASLVLLEKEVGVAMHQSGRNSGVLHSGIYYKPGSLKAQLNANGRQAMLDFCQEQDVGHELCGKVILATKENELSVLAALYARATENHLDVHLINPSELTEIEPHAWALKALWVPQAGIVDFKGVASRLASQLTAKGVHLKFSAQLLNFSKVAHGLLLETSVGKVRARFAINCAGLYSDRLARLTGIDPGVRIVPFRGEYFRLKPEARNLVRGLIYPVPDPLLPFLGVHLTKMLDGEVLAGPNAVLSLYREGYQSRDFSFRDTLESLSYSGFWRMILPNLRTGLSEMTRSWNVDAFARALQHLVPEIRSGDLLPGQAGVRAQAVGKDGKLVDDFVFAKGERWLHILNAPSPAATACLAIGELIASEARDLR